MIFPCPKKGAYQRHMPASDSKIRVKDFVSRGHRVKDFALRGFARDHSVHHSHVSRRLFTWLRLTRLCSRSLGPSQPREPKAFTWLPGWESLAAISRVFYFERQALHKFLGVRQIALCGREVKARSFYAVTGHDGVEDGFVFCGF